MKFLLFFAKYQLINYNFTINYFFVPSNLYFEFFQPHMSHSLSQL